MADGQSNGRKVAIALVLVSGLLIALLYWPSAEVIGRSWLESGYYEHGFVVFAFVVFLIFRDFPDGVREIEPTYLLLVPIAALSVLWLLFGLVNVQVGQVALLPPLWLLAAAAVIGWRNSPGLVFPILLLVMVVPIWSLINPGLQALTVVVVTEFLRQLGIPAFVEGNFVTIPAGVLHVAEGCSGLKYFMVTLTLTAIYSNFYLQTYMRQILFVAMGVVIGLAANWIRVTIVIAVAHHYGIDHQVVIDHNWVGWLVFVIAFSPLLLVGDAMRDKSDLPTGDAEVDSQGQQLAPGRTGASAVVAGIAVATALAVGPALDWLIVERDVGKNSKIEFSADSGKLKHEDWLGPLPAKLAWDPAFVGASDRYRAAFRTDDASVVELRALLYGSESQGVELVYWGNTIADSRLWPQSGDEHMLEMPGNFNAKTVEIRARNGDLFKIAYWFHVGDWKGVSKFQTKFRALPRKLAGNEWSGLVAIATACLRDCTEAEQLLKKFVMDMSPRMISSPESEERNVEKIVLVN